MAVRKAGNQLRAATGAPAATDADWVTTLALLGGGGALGAAGVAGLVDLFAGSANIGNSGGNEYLANSVINMIPAAGLMAGAGAAVAIDPVSRALANEALSRAAAKTAAEKYGVAAMNTYLGQPQGNAAGEATADTERTLNSVAASRRNLVEKVMNEVNRKPDMSDAEKLGQVREILRRGNRNLALGGGLGAMVGAVPAIMMMQDAPRGSEG